MSDASLLLFVPTLFAMLCLFARRNFFCMYISLMIWLQSVVVTAAWRPHFSLGDRTQISFVCILLVILCFAAVLRFSKSKASGKKQ